MGRYRVFFRKTAAFLSAAVLASSAFGCSSGAPGVSADEWVKTRFNTLGTLSELTKNMDDVVSLYSIGSMDYSDFLNEAALINGQLNVLETSIGELEVKAGTHTEETKIAFDEYKLLWSDLHDLCYSMMTEERYATQPDVLVYNYLAYQASIAEHLSAYTSAYNSISGEGD